MRKLIFILIALISFSQAQTIQYIGAPTTTVISRGNFRTDSIFYLPKRTKTPTDTAAFRYQISDSSLYYWTGYQWTKVQSASSFASVDTTVISTRAYRQKGIDSVQYNVGLKVNITDTSNMLSPYFRKVDTATLSNRINLKLNISDTSTMLSPYARTSDVNASLALKLNISDTSTMLSPYFRKVDTLTLSNRINLKLNISDTSTMLSPYARTSNVNASLATKVNISDTSTMLSPYLRKSDTLTLSNRINLKVNISDTASMLTPYLRKVDTTAMLSPYYRSATATAALATKLNISDTSTMLSPYIRHAGYGLTKSGQALIVDTLNIATKAWRQKGDDSLGAIIATKGSGTVTSVATGYGLSGGTINTTGTLIADTALVASRLRLGKVADSLSLVKQNVLTNPVTGTGTTNYVPKFTGTSTIGNSQIFDNGTNVGINTVSPSFKLDVNGTAKTGTLTINTNGQGRTISTYYGSNSDGGNIFIGGGGGSSIGVLGETFRGSNNISIGVSSLLSNTSGYNNTAIGTGALQFNTTASSNIAIGTYASYSVTTGVQNTAIGNTALFSSNGDQNVAIGLQSATAVTNGYQNTSIGTNSLLNLTTGNNIVAIGYNAGNLTSADAANQTSSTSVYVGSNTKSSADGNTNEIVIGNFAIGRGSNTAVIGNSSIITTFLRGETLINTTTDAGAYTLQNNGALYNTGSAILAATSGNVGIGTASPTQLLELSRGNNASSIGLFIKNSVGSSTNNSADIWFGNYDGASTSNIYNARISALNTDGNFAKTALLFYTYNGSGSSTGITERMRITSDGNIGIGTTSPTQKFVVSNGGAEGIESIPATTTNTNLFLSYNRNTNAYSNLITRASTHSLEIGTTSSLYINSASETLFGTTTDAGNYRVQVSGNAYVTGDAILAASSGNVGIGTTSPSTLLTLSQTGAGTVGPNLRIHNTSSRQIGNTARISFAPNADYTTTVIAAYIDVIDTDGVPANFAAMAFGVGAGGTPTERMRITSIGNVGIGTTSPSASAQLDVSSTTRGFLPPRMTTTQRDAISSPVAGLVIYNTTTSKLQVYTTSWTDLH